ncbi:MAG: hypothetical protein KF821_05860 [Anaerolineales bacterium]|jgi:hypothetical protein|nr:hypothetical protein [Anaerolineales bacterium]MBX3005337.1 hypothetical protein [Anaerolineales bacterium]
MDEFDFKEEKPKGSTRTLSSALLNLGSLVALLATLCSGGFFWEIFNNPDSDWNPLPPLTATVAPSSTAELPTATLQPTLAPTLAPSATPQPSATLPALIYQLQEGSPAYLEAALFRPEQACNFLGVFGLVFGLDDSSRPGIRVQVSGTLNGQPVDKLGLTGAAMQYGAGAYYEIQLADKALASDNSLQIVLLNEAGLPLSAPVSFSTRSECNQNLIMINFREQP